MALNKTIYLGVDPWIRLNYYYLLYIKDIYFMFILFEHIDNTGKTTTEIK